MILSKDFYIIKPFDECLCIKSFMAWDQRVFQEWYIDVIEIIEKNYAQRKWCLYIDAVGWELSTPESEKLANQAGLEFPYMPSHCAQAIGESHIKPWQIEKMWKGISTTKLQTFKTHQEALGWLSAQGYKVPPVKELPS